MPGIQIFRHNICSAPSTFYQFEDEIVIRGNEGRVLLERGAETEIDWVLEEVIQEQEESYRTGVEE